MEDKTNFLDSEIQSNKYSLFQVFCQKCNKLILIKDDIMTSSNCSHITCRNCSPSNCCSICQREIFIDENDTSNSDFYKKCLEKQTSLSFNQIHFSNCFRKIGIQHKDGEKEAEVYCEECYDEEIRSKDHSKCEQCEICFLAFKLSFLCKSCSKSKKHTHKNFVDFDEKRAEILEKLENHLNWFKDNEKSVDNVIYQLSKKKETLEKNQKIQSKKIPDMAKEIKTNLKSGLDGESKKISNELDKKEKEIDEQLEKLNEFEKEINSLEETLSKIEAKEIEKLKKKPNYFKNQHFEKFVKFNSDFISLLDKCKFERIDLKKFSLNLEDDIQEKANNLVKVTQTEKSFWEDNYNNISFKNYKNYQEEEE